MPNRREKLGPITRDSNITGMIFDFVPYKDNFIVWEGNYQDSRSGLNLMKYLLRTMTKRYIH